MKIITIGRKGTDVVIPDESLGISRLHAELTVTETGKLFLVDCGSSYGTFIRKNGDWEKIQQTWIDNAGEIRIGRHVMKVADLLAKIPQ